MPGFVLLYGHLCHPTEGGSLGAVFQSFPLRYLAGGVTTTRTAGRMSPFADLNTARNIATGAQVGPDIDATVP